jgi:hypothetical protein
MGESMCAIRRTRDEFGSPTLGIFKPRQIQRLVIETEESPEWTPAELQRLRQDSLFGNAPAHELVKIPLKFSYEFDCTDPGCRGHKMMCTDWEMAAAYLSWTREYGSEWETKFRQTWESDVQRRYDTHFFVGTVHGHPNDWIIMGVFRPTPAPGFQQNLL